MHGFVDEMYLCVCVFYEENQDGSQVLDHFQKLVTSRHLYNEPYNLPNFM